MNGGVAPDAPTSFLCSRKETKQRNALLRRASLKDFSIFGSNYKVERKVMISRMSLLCK